MANIYTLVARLDGWPGAPGYMTFRSSTAGTFRASVIAFIDRYAAMVPNTVQLTVPNQGDIIDDATGELIDSWTEGVEYNTGGPGSSTMAAPSGACINWLTTEVVNGRRLRGRTFLVPLGVGSYQNDGTLLPAALADIQDAAVDLFTACDLVVWHRPTTPGGSDGLSAEVVGVRVSDRAAVLRSRRA